MVTHVVLKKATHSKQIVLHKHVSSMVEGPGRRASAGPQGLLPVDPHPQFT